MLLKKIFLPAILVTIILTLNGCGGGSSESASEPPVSAWSIPVDEVVDGGPGRDGIPSIDSPKFITASEENYIAGGHSDLILGFVVEGQAYAFPHNVLDWHEIINFSLSNNHYVINYCPLTGSGMLWLPQNDAINKTYGTSGLLYNSNLILYDRDTESNWSQMLARSVNGAKLNAKPSLLPILETKWGTWKDMYPDTLVLSSDTGFSRSYNTYPYGNYLSTESLLFPVSHSDNRLHPKTRVLGVSESFINKVYPIDLFGPGINVINEDASIADIVVIGSSDQNFGVAFSSRMQDGTRLEFVPSTSGLPVIMQDNEGNEWNIFGVAVSGPRQGQELTSVNSYISYWFAWAAFFPDAVINN